jgi:alanine racemase
VFDPSTSRSRAWVEVHLERLRENALAVQRAVGPHTRLLPMVKADAYGLGAGAVVGALATGPAPDGPWGFGVAAVAEGEALRAAGWAGRILVTAPTPPQEYERAAASGLTLALSDVAGVRRWAAVAERAGRGLAFHLEVDTGMGRAGLPWREAATWSAQVAAAAEASVDWEGTFTHFHSADEPDLAPTDEQWARFQSALESLPSGMGRTVVHAANSAASLRRAGFGCDLVRPGIYLFGGSAGPGVAPLPVVSVRARLVLVHDVEPGATVGYGATYRATRRERWGTVSIGYGDGLPRALSPGGGEAIVRGRRVPMIGRVSMDMTTIDLTDGPDAGVGDEVTLIGVDGDVEITLDEVARRCGTISYEVLTGLTPRLPRCYVV